MGRFYLLATVLVVIFLIVAFSFIISTYKKCPPGHVLIINNNKPDSFGNLNKILFSGGAFVWPMVGSYQLFSLAPMPIDLHGDFFTQSAEKVSADIKAHIGISASETVLKNAIDRISGLDSARIKQLAHDVILVQIRNVISSTQARELSNLQAVSSRLKKDIEGGLMELGLKLISLDVKKIL